MKEPFAFEPAEWPMKLADRCNESRPEVVWLDPARLDAVEQAHWSRLSQQSGGTNVFALDWFMRPAIAAYAGGAPLRLAVTRWANGDWLGAIPLRLERSIGRCPVPCLSTWSATNQFIGSPLTVPGAEKEFWQALLATLDRRPGVAIALRCQDMPIDDSATLALLSLCAEDGRGVRMLQRFGRSARHPRPSVPPPSANLRKAQARLNSLQKRLERDHGPVRLRSLSPNVACNDWIEQFLWLERAGWKGTAGSALASAEGTAGLFREVISEGRARGHARLASLEVGERTAAMTSWFEIGGRGYGFKMAHDERFRKYAPGRMLMRAVAETFASDPALAFDTCAASGAGEDPLWPDTRAFVDLAIPIGSRARRGLLGAALEGAELWRNLRAETKVPIAARA